MPTARFRTKARKQEKYINVFGASLLVASLATTIHFVFGLFIVVTDRLYPAINSDSEEYTMNY